MGFTYNPFTGNLDYKISLTSPLQFVGSIDSNDDFPTSSEVQNGWFYKIAADVTDNDVSKTNTGQSFQEGDEIIWTGTDWTVAGNELIYVPYSGATGDVDVGSHDVAAQTFTLPSGVEISESATGRIRFRNPNPVYPSITESNLYLGLNSSVYQWGASIDVTDNTGSGGKILYFMCTPLVADNKFLMLGGQSSAGIRFVNGGSTDDGVMEFYTHTAGAAECTGIVRVRGESAPTQTTNAGIVDPQLHVCANDTTLTHHIGMQHNKTDGEIYTGAGDLKLSPASGTVALGSNNLNTTGDVTAGTVTVDDDSVIVGQLHQYDIGLANPNGLYNNDSKYVFGFTSSAIVVTRVVAKTDSSSYELSGNVKWASDMTSFTGATTINSFSTSSGVLDDSTITAGSVAADKVLYLEFTAEPNVAITKALIHIEWRYA